MVQMVQVVQIVQIVQMVQMVQIVQIAQMVQMVQEVQGLTRGRIRVARVEASPLNQLAPLGTGRLLVTLERETAP